MKNKKIPMRSCVVSREKLPKQELIRIVKNKENNVFVDVTGKQNGRGIYIKKDLEVLEKAKKSKIMDKLLETKIEDSIYDELESIIKNY